MLLKPRLNHVTLWLTTLYDSLFHRESKPKSLLWPARVLPGKSMGQCEPDWRLTQKLTWSWWSAAVAWKQAGPLFPSALARDPLSPSLTHYFYLLLFFVLITLFQPIGLRAAPWTHHAHSYSEPLHFLFPQEADWLPSGLCSDDILGGFPARAILNHTSNTSLPLCCSTAHSGFLIT